MDSIYYSKPPAGQVANGAAVHAVHSSVLTADANLTSVFGPPTPHKLLTVVITNPHGQKTRVRVIRDTGAPKSCCSEKMATMLGLEVCPTNDMYSVVGNAAQTKLLGVCYNVPIKLLERLGIPNNLYVVPGDVVILVANDVFSSGCANIVAVVAQHSYYVI